MLTSDSNRSQQPPAAWPHATSCPQEASRVPSSGGLSASGEGDRLEIGFLAAGQIFLTPIKGALMSPTRDSTQKSQ